MNQIARTFLMIALLVAISAHTKASLADAEISLSAETITTTDRLTINLTFTLDPGEALKPWTAAAKSTLENAGWTVLTINHNPPTIATKSDPPGSLVHSATITLEPFLPGQYTIPPISASIIPSPDSTDSQTELTTEMRTIEVASVLPKDEPARLPLPISEPTQQDQTDNSDAPLGTLRPVPDEPEKSNTILLIIGVVAALLIASIAILIGIRGARQIKTPRPTDPIRALEKIANSKSPDLAAIDKNVRTLANKPNPETPALLALLTDLESIRYGPDSASISTQQASTIAKQAAAIAKRIRKNGPAGGAQ